MRFSFIIGIRDRGSERLAKSLESLRNQSCCDFEVIVVDYGSSKECSASIERTTSLFSFCRYVYSDTRGWIWNRSAALNIGARMARGQFVFLTDVDIFYPLKFVDRVLELQEEGVFFTSSCFPSPKNFKDWEGLANGRVEYSWPEMKGRGLLCCSKKALENVGGMDEQFGYWGQEDHDFAERLKRSGVRELLDGGLYCYHQWHPKVIYQLPSGVQYNNLARFYGACSEKRIVVNIGKEWGVVVTEADRAIYEHINPDSGEIIDDSLPKYAEAYNVADLISVTGVMASNVDALWALPLYRERGVFVSTANRVLRRFGLRVESRAGYASEVIQGLLFSVPLMFDDYFLPAHCRGETYFGSFTARNREGEVNTMKADPYISVILPTYNRRKLLQEAIQSVIDQEYVSWELIVWDDGSTDGTRKVLERYNSDSRIHWSSDVNKGKCYALNRALEMVKGEVVAFLDDDDLWHPKKLSLQAEVMKRHPDVDVLFSNYDNLHLPEGRSELCFDHYKRIMDKFVVEESVDGVTRVDRGILGGLVPINIALPSASVVRMSHCARIGEFNESLKSSEDMEYWFRAFVHGGVFAYTPDVLTVRRKWEGSLSNRGEATLVGNIIALDACVEIANGMRGSSQILRALRRAKGEDIDRLMRFHLRLGNRRSLWGWFGKRLRYGLSVRAIRIAIADLVGRGRWTD